MFGFAKRRKVRPIVFLHGLGGASDVGSHVILEKIKATVENEGLELFIYNAKGLEAGDSLQCIEHHIKALHLELKQVNELSQGFNFIGEGQGGLVGRAFVELVNDPPVYQFFALHAPLCGTFYNKDDFQIRVRQMIPLEKPARMVAWHVSGEDSRWICRNNYEAEGFRSLLQVMGLGFFVDCNTSSQFIRHLNKLTEEDSRARTASGRSLSSLDRLYAVKASEGTLVLPTGSSFMEMPTYEDDYQTAGEHPDWWKSKGLLKMMDEGRLIFREHKGGEYQIDEDDLVVNEISKYLCDDRPTDALPYAPVRLLSNRDYALVRCYSLIAEAIIGLIRSQLKFLSILVQTLLRLAGRYETARWVEEAESRPPIQLIPEVNDYLGLRGSIAVISALSTAALAIPAGLPYRKIIPHLPKLTISLMLVLGSMNPYVRKWLYAIEDRTPVESVQEAIEYFGGAQFVGPMVARYGMKYFKKQLKNISWAKVLLIFLLLKFLPKQIQHILADLPHRPLGESRRRVLKTFQ